MKIAISTDHATVERNPTASSPYSTLFVKIARIKTVSIIYKPTISWNSPGPIGSLFPGKRLADKNSPS